MAVAKVLVYTSLICCPSEPAQPRRWVIAAHTNVHSVDPAREPCPSSHSRSRVHGSRAPFSWSTRPQGCRSDIWQPISLSALSAGVEYTMKSADEPSLLSSLNPIKIYQVLEVIWLPPMRYTIHITGQSHHSVYDDVCHCRRNTLRLPSLSLQSRRPSVT